MWSATRPPQAVLREVVQETFKPFMLMVLELPVMAIGECVYKLGLLRSEEEELVRIGLQRFVEEPNFVDVQPHRDELRLRRVRRWQHVGHCDCGCQRNDTFLPSHHIICGCSKIMQKSVSEDEFFSVAE